MLLADVYQRTITTRHFARKMNASSLDPCCAVILCGSIAVLVREHVGLQTLRVRCEMRLWGRGLIVMAIGRTRRFLAALASAVVILGCAVGLAAMEPRYWYVGLGTSIIALGLLLLMLRGKRGRLYRTSLAKEFRRKANLGSFVDKNLRDRVASAISIWEEAENLARRGAELGLGGYLEDKLRTLEQSVEAIYQVAWLLDQLQRRPYVVGGFKGGAPAIPESRRPSPDAIDQQTDAALEQEGKSGDPCAAAMLADGEIQLDKALAILRMFRMQVAACTESGRGYVCGSGSTLANLGSTRADLEREIIDLRALELELRSLVGGSDQRWR